MLTSEAVREARPAGSASLANAEAGPPQRFESDAAAAARNPRGIIPYTSLLSRLGTPRIAGDESNPSPNGWDAASWERS